MYATHQPVISAWARQSPDNLARVLQFCIISARQKFFNVATLMQDAEEGRAGALYGWKHDAYNAFWNDRTAIFHNCEEIARLSVNRRERGALLVRYFASLPGLDLVKGGFAAQLAYGCGGCIDSVNVQRLGLPPNVFNGSRARRMKRQRTPARRSRLATWYVSLCERAGGPGGLWDDWCIEMSERYPVAFTSAEAVSAYHLKCLGLT